MDDLVRWLGEQLDADERRAVLLSLDVSIPDQWEAKRTRQYNCGEFTIWSGDRKVAAEVLEAAAIHIAGHDPARVLREIDAKRQMLTLHEPGETEYVDGDVCMVCEDPDVGDEGPFYPCRTLRLLALAYADRPGYRAEWRP